MSSHRRKSCFHQLYSGVIIFTAVLMGLETSAPLMTAYGPLFRVLNGVVQAIFVAEIVIRLAAHWPRPGRFFRDGWNVFDFLIVAASLLPQTGAFAMVARLARLLRVARLLSVSAELRLIISTMLRSIPSLGNVTLLLGLLLYVYSIIGYHLFHVHDPKNWGTLPQALLTLFQMLTLEGWVEVQATSLKVYPWAWIFYISYVVIAVFVVVNLFIAVVLNNLENAKDEEKAEVDAMHPQADLLARIAQIKSDLELLENTLRNSNRAAQIRWILRRALNVYKLCRLKPKFLTALL
jgi:voltage-gated sodium channel